MAYVKRTGHEDDATQWKTASVFEHCVSVRIDGARGLPEAFEVVCEVQAGTRVRPVPLLLSQADLEAGGGGRIDGGQLSERVDLLNDIQPQAVELRLLVKAYGPMWTTRSQKLVGRLVLADRWFDALTVDSSPSKWVSLRVVAPDGRDGGREASHRAQIQGARGPALLVRVQCFERIDLESESARGRLFREYASNGDVITEDDFGGLLADIAAGRRDASGVRDAASRMLAPPRKGGCCHACVASMLASVGMYKPESSLLSYLMYYHTLMWVVCRAPGEEHIPVCHRFSFVLLSMAFNLFVLVLFTATDMSLVSINCPEDNKDGVCSQLSLDIWNATNVLVVAILDTAFWPLLKAAFYLVEDVLSGRDRLGLDDRLWRILRYLLLSLLGCLLLWCSVSAAKHHQDVMTILTEFVSTWPAARATETFKLMSLWGVLVEYAMPEPRPEGKDSPNKGAPHTPSSIPSERRVRTLTIETDPKREPLLANQVV